MKVSIVAIGDELLIGQVTDTNSGAIARIMAPYGWGVERVTITGDNARDIRSAIDNALSESQVVITTGGLGPTRDDITKSVLCDRFGGRLVYDADVARDVADVFAARGLEMNPMTASQAMVPDCCTVIRNHVGTAPVMWFESADRVLVSLPGVPRECLYLFENEVLPRLVNRYGVGDRIIHKTLVLHGISESAVAGILQTVEDDIAGRIKLAYLPSPGYLRLRLTGTDAGLLDNCFNNVAEILSTHIIATADLSPAEALVTRLREIGATVCTAESCTGGSISSRIVAIAGCSDVMLGGIVAYHNDVKSRCLGVDPDIINTYGAVSQPTAIAMAQGARQLTGADTVIVTTGIAGPGGGTPDKPVGTVWTARCTPDGIVTTTLNHFTGSRAEIIDRASNTAIAQLVLALK